MRLSDPDPDFKRRAGCQRQLGFLVQTSVWQHFAMILHTVSLFSNYLPRNTTSTDAGVYSAKKEMGTPEIYEA